MKKTLNSNKAQSIFEYIVFVALAAAIFFGVRTYILRAVQAKYKESADVFGQGEQFRKGVTIEH